jgi:hypothetical protein
MHGFIRGWLPNQTIPNGHLRPSIPRKSSDWKVGLRTGHSELPKALRHAIEQKARVRQAAPHLGYR